MKRWSHSQAVTLVSPPRGVNAARHAPPRPLSPAQSAPAYGATVDLASQPFAWYEMSRSPRVFVLSMRFPDFALDLVTTDLAATLPDPTSFGLSWPKNLPGTWRVFGTTALGRIDEAAGPSAWLPLFTPNYGYPSQFGSEWHAPSSAGYVFSRTSDWTLRTAP